MILKLPNTFRFIIGVSLLVFACGTTEEFGNAATENYSRAEKQKFAKYMIQGKDLYTIHCSNCHQPDGSGLGKLYPPLAKSDYLANNLEKSICIIKNGIEGEITVNGELYNQLMPGVENLSALEIAEITTYITNSWESEKGLVDVKQVNQALENCQ